MLFSTYVKYLHALRFIFVSWKFKPYHSEVAWIPFLNPPWIAPRKWLKPSFKLHLASFTAKDWDHFCFFLLIPWKQGCEMMARWWPTAKHDQMGSNDDFPPFFSPFLWWNQKVETTHQRLFTRSSRGRRCLEGIVLRSSQQLLDGPLALRVLVRSGEHGSWESWSSCKDESKPFQTYWLYLVYFKYLGHQAFDP